jgi:phage FluMu protein Com
VSEPNPTVVRCGSCNALLAEPSDLAAEKRRPCPECDSLVRTFEVGLTAIVTAVAIDTRGDVTVSPPAAEARASTGLPTVRVEAGAGADAPAARIEELEDAGYDVSWLQLSPGGAWMVRVFDRGGEFIDGAVADDPVDAILEVCERLVPR